MSQIKIVPDGEPNADGEWIEIPVNTAQYRRWRHMEEAVMPHVPRGYHVVQVGQRPPEARLRTIPDILQRRF